MLTVLCSQLRCCCSGSDHHHQSFATPAYNAASSRSHDAHQHQHNHVIAAEPHQNSAQSHSQPSNHAFHAHHHYHAHCPELPYASSQSSLHPPSTASESIASQSTASNTTLQSPFLHNGQSIHSSHFAHLSNGFSPAMLPYGQEQSQEHVDKLHLASLLPSHMSHTRSQSLPMMNPPIQPVGPPQADQPLSSSNTANPTFKCEWSSCSATFPTREELVGHVNVSHLIQAKPSSTATIADCTPPTPAQSHIVGANRLSETRNGSNAPIPSAQAILPATSHIYQPHGHYHPNSNSNASHNVFGNLQNQPTDPSFDHTLRCLWDSCEASLPMLSDTMANTASSSVSIHQHPPSSTQVNGLPANGFDSHAPLQVLPDQTTANLVRHLLQDHLHLPTDVLGQLSPALPMPHVNGHAVPGYSNSTSVVDGMSQHGSYMSSAPVSNHSTPHSMVRHSAVPSPVVYKPPPTPPQVASEQQFKFDFGLSSIPAFESWPIEVSKQVQAQQPSSTVEHADEKVRDLHSCKWKGCSMNFENTAEMMEHISTEHIGSGKSMYHCEWEDCDRAHEGRGFNQRQKVMRHVRTHVGDKPFVCKECGRAFSESTTLAQVSTVLLLNDGHCRR